MTIAAASMTTVAIDPAILALLPIVGVTLTIVAGLVGAWIQGRREHERWVREQRYEAYTRTVHIGSTVRAVAAEIVAIVRDVQAGNISENKRQVTAARLQERTAHLNELGDAVAERMAPLVILGPKTVSDAYGALIASMSPPEEMDLDKVNRAESVLGEAMRKALGIKDY